MQITLIKRMMDSFYLAKRIRDMLPQLPDGIVSSHIQYLDVIQQLEQQGVPVKISDISDALALPRPGVTRTVKDMVQKGLLEKLASPEDGRVTYLSITEPGRQLSEKYNTQFFSTLSSYLDDISEEDAQCTIRTIEKFYNVMSKRRDSFEK